MYIVYYNAGGCNDGDHENGLQVCDTTEEVSAFKIEFEKHNINPKFVVIRGEIIEGSVGFQL